MKKSYTAIACAQFVSIICLRIINDPKRPGIVQHARRTLIGRPLALLAPRCNANMNTNAKRSVRKKPRISLTGRQIADLFAIQGTRSVALLAKQTGLSYMHLYNIVHRRVRSVSNRTSLQLFGKLPPAQDSLKVDGTLFRKLADLWVFLDGATTKAALCRDLLGQDRRATVDHRLFSGRIGRVDARLEHALREKFAAAGVDRPLLEQWLKEFDGLPHEQWVPYAHIRPALNYLEKALGIHPTSVLHQSVARYESGVLKRVSKGTADRIMRLKEQTERALQSRPGPRQLECVRESLTGGRSDYTLFSEIEADLLFLCRHGKRGVKHYLGRSLWTYRNGRAKRVADWRARRIVRECDRLIGENPNLPMASLPPRRRYAQIRALIDVMVARSGQLLSGEEGIAFEKRILRPSQPQLAYQGPQRRFTPFDMASGVLGMRRKAFDLMVASHCDIFRSVGKYSQRWYLPDRYLEELTRKRHFGLISAKYERLARDRAAKPSASACLN